MFSVVHDKYTGKIVGIITSNLIHSLYQILCCLHADQILPKLPAPRKSSSRPGLLVINFYLLYSRCSLWSQKYRCPLNQVYIGWHPEKLYLGKKCIYCIFKTGCAVSILFPTNFIFFSSNNMFFVKWVLNLNTCPVALMIKCTLAYIIVTSLF